VLVYVELSTVLRLGEGRADEAFEEVESVTSECPEHVEKLMEMAGQARDLDTRHNATKEEGDEEKTGEDELEAR